MITIVKSKQNNYIKEKACRLTATTITNNANNENSNMEYEEKYRNATPEPALSTSPPSFLRPKVVALAGLSLSTDASHPGLSRL